MVDFLKSEYPFIKVDIVADSFYMQYGATQRITTFQLEYPRFIHGEILTHRTFCLAGDCEIDFDLPSGSQKKYDYRKYSMSLRTFYDKWINGAVEGKSPRHQGNFLDLLPAREYSSFEIKELLGLKSTMNLNQLCREGVISEAYKKNKLPKGRQDLEQRKLDNCWFATGAAWMQWRNSTGLRRFSLKSRLKEMRIRQINETSEAVQHSRVVNCVYSGIKEVFRVITANDYSTVSSKDHLFFTQRGWVPLKELIVGQDYLITYKHGQTSREGGDPFRKIDGKWVNQWVREVKNEIAERQGWVCALSGEPLEPVFDIHHVKPKHKFPELAFDKNNVIAVNTKHHKLEHTIQGWQKGSPLTTCRSLITEIVAEGLQDTYDLEIAGEFPNFFSDGIVVHNSRNSASSRAIPSLTMIKQVEENPVRPIVWLATHKGMQGTDLLDKSLQPAAEELWLAAAYSAAKYARELTDLGVSKQLTNRLLEPFQIMKCVVTATSFDNFFNLRCHPAAENHMRYLAEKMKQEYDKSLRLIERPKGKFFIPSGEESWHLPYVTIEERSKYALEDLLKFSTARCARVSFMNHDKSNPVPEKDIELHDSLVVSKPQHASPAEHQAMSGDFYTKSNNFTGWWQYRQLLEQGYF